MLWKKYLHCLQKPVFSYLQEFITEVVMSAHNHLKKRRNFIMKWAEQKEEAKRILLSKIITLFLSAFCKILTICVCIFKRRTSKSLHLESRPQQWFLLEDGKSPPTLTPGLLSNIWYQFLFVTTGGSRMLWTSSEQSPEPRNPAFILENL